MNKKGFTLIELLAIIVILAVIMAIAIPQVLNVVNGSKSSAWKDNVKMMAKSIELNTQLFDAETGNYTYTVDSLCKNPSKVNEISKSSDTSVTCSNGVFTISGTGQFDGFYANISCTGNECNPNVFSENNKFCALKSGKALAVGSKYECDPGDGTKRIFYVLAVNSNTVDLIMERNLSDTVGNFKMAWSDAMAYFTTGAGASTKASWKNVINVDLPSAQDIVDASLIINPKENWSFDIKTAQGTAWCFGSHVLDQPSGPDYCPTSTAQQKASWLFDYTKNCGTRGCSHSLPQDGNYAWGYWSKDLVANDSSFAWYVHGRGMLNRDPVSNTNLGVRPVITVLKSSLD